MSSLPLPTVMAVFSSSSSRYAVEPELATSVMIAAVFGPMPSSSWSVAGDDARDELVGREGLHDLGRSQVGADAVGLLARSVEQVGDTFQRLCGPHRGNANLADRTTRGQARLQTFWLW